MNVSYWELKNWFSDIDYTIVGSGIVGINTALRLKEKYPESKIIILERGILPQGASTKNAGFASFGSISEIIEDLKNHTQEEVIQLIKKRWEGLQFLRLLLGDNVLDYRLYGGYELFLKEDVETYNECIDKLPFINDILKPLFKSDVFIQQTDRFAFRGICSNLIFNPFEGQIDTGKMMQALLKKAAENNIYILNSQSARDYFEFSDGVKVVTEDITFNTKKLLFATNGFSAHLTNNEVVPARAQVLITEPIPDLHIKGTFHIDKGYYYFRNIENRILLGGARNLDFEGETTTEFGVTPIIQKKLESVLEEIILPGKDFKIAHRWSGIMGMGTQKIPIVKQLSEHVYCGVRLSGMGIAIGSTIGRELADLIK